MSTTMNQSELSAAEQHEQSTKNWEAETGVPQDGVHDPSFTMDAALGLIPEMLGDKLLGALTRKYDQKYSKLPGEQASHKEAFPAYAENTAMLYVLVSAKQEAEEKIASEDRVRNIANAYTAINSYSQAEVLTERQVQRNEEIDRELAELRDEVSIGEYKKILQGVRANWVKMLDYGYVRSQDNKLRRACHIFGTTIDAIAR